MRTSHLLKPSWLVGYEGHLLTSGCPSVLFRQLEKGMHMNIGKARRIVHFADDFHMSDERLAQQLDCTVSEARVTLAKARSTVRVADARNAVNELKRLAAVFNVSTYDLVTMFA